MKDYTKQPLDLLTRLRMSYAGKYSPLQVEAADAIESLQEKNALLEGTLESRERNIEALLNKNFAMNNEHFEQLLRFEANIKALLAKRDALQAKLDALQTQEPVASIYIAADGDREMDDWKCDLPLGRNELYAAPKALEPVVLGECNTCKHNKQPFSACDGCSDFVNYEAPEPQDQQPLTDEQQRTMRHQISVMQSAYNVLTDGPMVRGCKYSRELTILDLKRCLDAAYGIGGTP